MVVAASILHKHHGKKMPEYRGSTKGRRVPDVQGPFPALQRILPPHLSGVQGEHVLVSIPDVKRPVHGYYTGHQRLCAYFQCRPDATGKLGFAYYHKWSAAIRMLSYGMSGDIFDEYLRMSEINFHESMYRFCRAVNGVFDKLYLRAPTVEDTRRMLSISEARGFPGMNGSIYCKHWLWKNCAFAWQGQYNIHAEGCNMILEAVASQYL
jgi:hypothetical protein